MFSFFNLRRAGPIGVDLGSRSVKMVQFSANREQLIAAGRWEFPAAASPEQHAEHVAETIQRGLTERKFVGRDVVLCLGDKELVLQNIRVPKSDGVELDRHVAQEAAGRVPFGVEEAEIRYFEAADVRQGDAVLREVIVFACHRPVLQKSLDMAAKSHLNPLAVDVEPAALVRSYAAQFRRQEDFDGRALVIHVGHQRTAVVITQGVEMLFVKYIDIGGAHLDTAVARHLRMEAKEAADLRRHSGDRRADLQDPEVMRSVSEATRGVIERLGSELALCIRYHSVTFRGQPLARVVLGGGEATPQLADVLGKMLNLKCELSDPFRALSLQRDVGRRGLWDVAAGLALREVKKLPVKNIDFLPDVYRQRRVLRHARHCWMAVAMLFGLAIAGAASGQWYFRCSLAAQLQVVEPQHVISEQRQVEITQLEESQKRTEELAALYLYLEHPWPRTQLLAAVARSLPPSIQLTDLRMLEQADSGTVALREGGDTNRSIGEGEKAEKPTPTSVLSMLRAEHDRQVLILELSGQAANSKELHEFVDSLAKSPLIASASLKGLEAGGEAMEKGASKFHVRAVVRPGYGQPGAPALKAGTADVAASNVMSTGTTRSSGGSP